MEITGQIQRCNVHLSITDQVIEKSGNEKSILGNYRTYYGSALLANMKKSVRRKKIC